MTGERANKTEQGSHEYTESGWYLCEMGDGRFYPYTGPQGTGRDSGHDFRTLREARRWARENPNQ